MDLKKIYSTNFKQTESSKKLLDSVKNITLKMFIPLIS